MYAWNTVTTVLSQFMECFPSKQTFVWFTCSVIAFLIRPTKTDGVSAIVRLLDLPASSYLCLDNFFKKGKFELKTLEEKWWDIVFSCEYLFTLTSTQCLVLVVDGTKQMKEGRRIPGVQKYGESSEDQTKPTYIMGLMFQCIAILAKGLGVVFAIPLCMHISHGVEATAGWKDSVYTSDSQIVKMVSDVEEFVKRVKHPVLLVGDRYYLSCTAIKAILKHNQDHPECKIYLLSKAKKGFVAYLPLTEEEKQKDKRKKKGKTVKLFDLFDECSAQFKEMKIVLYGEKVKARVYRAEFLWGKGVYCPMSFVFVQYEDKDDDGNTVIRRDILGCMDTRLRTEEIIQSYSHRFKIEVLFRTFKGEIAGMAFHFWSKAMPLLNRNRKKGDPDPLESITDEKDRANILNTLRAIERYVFCASVAIGIAQKISLEFPKKGDRKDLRFQRTPAGECPSEANIMFILSKYYKEFLRSNPKNFFVQAIARIKDKDEWETMQKEMNNAATKETKAR